MSKKIMLLTIAVMISLVTVVPVLAAAPAEGTVVEGESVPGIALGFTRAQVEAAYEEPDSCQSGQVGGDAAYCQFPVEGGGQVGIHYRGPDGSGPSNSPNDVVFAIRWYEQLSGWTTTAGINTTLAAQDPAAVIAAYPNAEVTYNQFGGIYSVVDHEGGVEVLWVPDFYSGRTHVNMAIFNPRPTPPPQEKTTRIVDIDLTARKVRGQRQINAQVQVHDERGYGAPGATVIASWVFPDGSTYTVQDTTRGSSGTFAYFSTNVSSRGTYTLHIDDILLDGYRFDAENSVLSASIKIK
jgi:hypothetical protein